MYHHISKLSKRIAGVVILLFSFCLCLFCAGSAPWSSNFHPKMEEKSKSQDNSILEIQTAAESQEAEGDPVLRLSLDINPELEISIDTDGEVLKLNAFNEDGEHIIQKLHHDDNIQVVLSQIILELIEGDYIKKGADDNFLLFCSYGKQSQEQQFQQLVDTVYGGLKENKINCHIWTRFITNDEKLIEDAEEYGISFGKLAFLNDAEQNVKGFKADDNIHNSVSDIWGRTYLNGTKSKYGIISEGYHFTVGEVDEFGEKVLYALAPQAETDSGYVAFDDLPKDYQDNLRELYNEEDIELMNKPRRWVTLPNVVGLSEEKALEVLHSRGIVVRIIYSDEGIDTYPEGYCYRQDLPAGLRHNTDASLMICIYKKGLKPTFTPRPKVTPTPKPTATPVPMPTSTPAPTETPTLKPTQMPTPTTTPALTATSAPMPTSTPAPTETPTLKPTQMPTPTTTPALTATSAPMPTSTPVPTAASSLAF